MKAHAAPANTAQSAPVAATVGHAEAASSGSMLGESSVQCSALQTRIDQSPRMLAQRRTMQAALGPVFHRDPDAPKGAAALQARFEGTAVQRARSPPASTEPRAASLESSSAAAGSTAASAATTFIRAEPVKARHDETGMPNQLKAGIESLSGMDMSGVRVHRNSDKPAQLSALAYAQGNHIHLGPGQEQHLPHEAWHVVQQAQGRVRPTMQMKRGVLINDDIGLEREADVMGNKANSGQFEESTTPLGIPQLSDTLPVQGIFWQWRVNQWYLEPPGQSTSSTTAVPTRNGHYEGEWIDDQVYEQHTDPTLSPFIRQGEKLVGERAYEKQQASTSPHAADVRATAVQSPGMMYGSGLHEVVPTSLAAEVAGSHNPSLMGAQSGFRTSTSRQVFLQADGEVGGHTGWARKPNSSRGSTHTKGQAAAHDQLRDEVRGIISDNEQRPDVVANRLLCSHLGVCRAFQCSER